MLVITGSRKGVAGPGTHISNGGSLKLDTLLNEGGFATLSGYIGRRRHIGRRRRRDANSHPQRRRHGRAYPGRRHPGGRGAGPGASRPPSAFALPAGGIERRRGLDYDLFRGGVGGSRPGDWFLRPDFAVPFVPLGPSTPLVPLAPLGPSLPSDPPPNPLPPSVAFPIIGPELATYGVVQPLARQLGLSILGTLDDRVGDTYEPDSCAVQPAVVASAAAETSAADLPTKKPAAVPTKVPGLRPVRYSRPRSGGASSAKQSTTTIKFPCRSQRQRQSGRLPGRDRSSARFAEAGQYERAGSFYGSTAT